MTTAPHHDAQRMELADYVRELTLVHRHTETYQVREAGTWVSRRHHTSSPSLLTQLWANDTPNAAEAGGGARPGYGSKPAAGLESLDAAQRIDVEASAWVRRLGQDDQGGTVACVLRLNGLAASVDHDTRKAILRDVRRWWTQARIVTGWDSPAWTPDNTCPICSERGTLRVRLSDRIAMCTSQECRTTWDETNLGLLADHIREESDTVRPPQDGPGPCWCPVPKPVVPDLNRMCPRCGSARCRHAVGARLLDTIRRDKAARLTPNLRNPDDDAWQVK